MKIRLDGYESALLGHRTSLVAPFDPTASQLLYGKGGLYSRIVDMPADKAVARGVTVEGDVDNKLSDELDRLAVLPLLADALRWARLTGGAGIVLLGDDALVNLPLSAENLSVIEEFQCFPLSAFSAGSAKYTDPNLKNYGKPTHYRVNTGNATFLVHESRIIEVSGDPLPSDQRGGIPWAGRSAITRVYPAIQRYTDSLNYSLNILQRKQQAIYGMSGLADLIREGLESAVQKRINLVDAVRGVLNTVAVDSEDTYSIEDTGLGGIEKLVQEFQVSVSSEAGIPVTIIFGVSPGGMNSTGEADFDGYHELVEGLQRTRLTPALERIVSLIFAQSSFPTPPDSWKIVWPPLASPSETEEATARKTNAEAQKIELEGLDLAVASSFVSEEEARAHIQNIELFGLSNDVDDTRAGAVDYARQT